MYLEMKQNISRHNNEDGSGKWNCKQRVVHGNICEYIYIYLLYWNWLALYLLLGLRRGGFFLGDCPEKALMSDPLLRRGRGR